MANEDEMQNNVSPELLAERQRKLLFRQQLYMYMAGMNLNATTSLDRASLLRAANPDRDYNFECGYPDNLSANHYQSLYDREGIATRVVSIYPEECWQVSPEIYETEKAEEKKFEKAIKDLDNKIKLFSEMERIDRLSGIGRYGIVLFGLNDGLELEQPVDGIDLDTGDPTGTPSKNREILYIRVFSESCLRIDAKETNPASPRFGLPTFYQITFSDQDATPSPVKGKRVHWTRVIHVADNLDSSLIYGTPRMQIVFNRLLDLRKVLAGSGEMFWKGGFPGYAFEVNPNLPDATLDVDSLKEQFRLMSQGLQRYIAIEGVSAKSLEVQLADPTGHLTCHTKAVAMSLGIPYRIFLGSEEAKLASTQDKQTWNTRLKRRQNKYLTPKLIRPMIDRLIAYGVLPQPVEYFVDWPDLDAPGDKEIAEIAKDVTEAMAKYQMGGVDDLIPPAEFLMMVLKMNQGEIDAITEARKIYIGEKDTERTTELDKREEDLYGQEQDNDAGVTDGNSAL